MYATGLSTTASRASRSLFRRLARWLAVARQEAGANVLEMAFVAMFMFVLIAGIVDLGGAYHSYIIAINGSREGARLYARLPCTSSTNRASMKSDIISAARCGAASSKANCLTNSLVSAANVTLSPNLSSACPAAGSTVSVAVQVDYKTTMGSFWGVKTFPIRARTSMMFYGTD